MEHLQAQRSFLLLSSHRLSHLERIVVYHRINRSRYVALAYRGSVGGEAPAS